MAVYEVLDFADILAAVREEIKVQSGDTATLNRIKRDINMAYLNEVIPYARWKWLQGFVTRPIPQNYTSAAVAVENGSEDCVFSTAPSASLGSFEGYKFNITGQAEIYTIASHTANTVDFTLDVPYNGPTATAGTFTIWRDYVKMPIDFRESIEVFHEFDSAPLEGRGLQDFKKIQISSPMRTGRPSFYYTGEFQDPSDNDAQTEADRYRLMYVWPSNNNSQTNLHINYIRKVSALENDADEPIMPVEDRIVLVYGALSRAWARESDPDEAARNLSLFRDRLARMAGKTEDTLDKPSFAPESIYIASKRSRSMGYRGSRVAGSAVGGGGSTAVTFVQDITIQGASLTANMTVSPSVTIDGRDLSADGAVLDAHIAATSGVHGVSGSVVGTTDTQTLSNKTYRLGASAQNFLLQGSNDTNGDITPSSVTASSLGFLTDASSLTTVTLTDNTSNVVAISLDADDFESAHIFYSLSRGSTNVETGFMAVTNDGTNAALAVGGIASIGTLGVEFDADLSGGNMRILATQSSTGTNATLKYKLLKWSN